MKFEKLEYAANPYLPGKEHIPDGEPHIFGNRLYVFGSHDEVGMGQYCTGSYVGWSTPIDNLNDWRYEGVILEKGQDPMDPDGTKNYYAPDVAQGPDGRYYLYYSIEGSMVISVAVANEPAGKYQFYGHVKLADGHVLGKDKGDDYQFDPAVFLDDDGKIYLYSGQELPIPEVNGRYVKGSMVCQLEEDMLTVIGQQRIITSNTHNCFTENPFFEASSMRKIDGKYYFIYSPLPNTHLLCYAVSDYPDKDFEYQGILVSNADIFINNIQRQEAMNYWGNNHGSIVEINNRLFVFYHRNTNKSPFARQGCVEELVRAGDGKLLQAELTSNGLFGKPFPAKGKYAAYIAWRLQKKDMPQFVPFQFLEYDQNDPYISEEDATPVPYIANIQDGSRVGFRYFNFDGTERTIEITVRGNAKGAFKIYAEESVIVSEITVCPSDQWNIVSGAYKGNKGKQSLLMTFEGDGAVDFLSFEIR